VTPSRRLILAFLAAIAVAGCDSMELTIAVESESGGSLVVANATTRPWRDARIVVEAVESDNSTSVCADRTVPEWRPTSTVTVPKCGDKVRLTLTTGGETARFSYANGQLFRRFGRKEVPVGSS
jgi:hypothetical protein